MANSVDQTLLRQKLRLETPGVGVGVCAAAAPSRTGRGSAGPSRVEDYI